jgi:hypothetical protein
MAKPLLPEMAPSLPFGSFVVTAQEVKVSLEESCTPIDSMKMLGIAPTVSSYYLAPFNGEGRPRV